MTWAETGNTLNTEPTGDVFVPKLEIAATPWQRMRGLLGRDGLAPGEGMLIKHCWSIHTFFMRFAIDVVYLNGDGRVLKIVENLAPWRLSCCWGARRTLELPAGYVAGSDIGVGASLVVSERN